ncbi:MULTISPECIES: ABC transporter permease [Psychrilyobacter]|uniref:ABC transporter permease n=1 Tax=Psychrilyobacter piezotolerans TaxID=2293438 RepID=A0ABX9KHJ0_9FUSO|nr:MULTISPECIES: ABC transporter permease [Psychrilyobacter]MCS5420693.1 ABC transporter permease [Psychrilyobacter sp. S5]NDI77867.1 ABC transporter permease [Psychrilyobacter piezotolerans]RDE62279.1 ABC transporter permease [Psychrilyobacter sp. S5]REI41377.1 ABC transporter permease [Psychrilyobacter piezotolerans]
MILGTLEQSLIFAFMVLGLYISYKILDFPDLTVDGSFSLGASVVAVSLVNGIDPIIAMILACIAGSLAGFITGYIHVKYNITNLLSGIIVMSGLYSINLRVMGRSNIPLFNANTMFTSGNSLLKIIVLLIAVKLILDFILKTKFGFALRAMGDNEVLLISLGINEKNIKIIGLMLANSLVAFSGGILAQYQGFSDIGMGTGTIITGLASIIIGESIFKETKFINMTLLVILGSVIYKFIISITLTMGMNPGDLKLITSIIVIAIMGSKNIKKFKGGAKLA